MTDISRHAERIKAYDYSIQEFSESLAGQMNIHDTASESQWINLAMITADYAIYKYKKSAEMALSCCRSQGRSEFMSKDIELKNVTIEKDSLDSIIIRATTDDGQEWMGFSSGPVLAWRKSPPKPVKEQ